MGWRAFTRDYAHRKSGICEVSFYLYMHLDIVHRSEPTSLNGLANRIGVIVDELLGSFEELEEKGILKNWSVSNDADPIVTYTINYRYRD